jgi:hypothetical protein
MKGKYIFWVMAAICVVAVMAMGISSFSQEQAKKKSARDLFYVGEAGAPSQAAAQVLPPPGLNYKIIKQTTSAAGCDIQWVDAKNPFKTGERIKLVVTSNTDGYLYLFHQGTSGAAQTLFPSAKINGGKNNVTKGVEYTIPPVGWWEFRPPTGTEKIKIFLCRQPINAFATYIVPANIQAVPINVITELQKSVGRDLQYVDTANIPEVQGIQIISPVQSFFVVNVAQDPNAIVSVAIDLIHQ